MEEKVADAIRSVTAAMQKAIDAGERSTHIDAEDLIDVLLSIADEIDPPLPSVVGEAEACPGCGERRTDQLIWQTDEAVRCFTCGTDYRPGG